MSNSCRFGWRLAALLAFAATTPARAAAPFGNPVDAASLARVRGGFSSADVGVAMAFNVRQSVYIDGSLTAASEVQVTQDGSRLSATGTSPTLVQVGTGNVAPINLSGMAAATTIVQNSLDNQKIGTVTTIDVSATILGAYRSMNLQSMLNGAITASLRR